MRLTRGAEYAVHALVHLARQGPRHVALTSEVARAERIPESFLAKIFKTLGAEGLVRSHQGRRGGIALAVPPETLTLRRVIEAVEGPLALNRCLVSGAACDDTPRCPLRNVLREAQEAMGRILESATIADLAREDVTCTGDGRFP